MIGQLDELQSKFTGAAKLGDRQEIRRRSIGQGSKLSEGQGRDNLSSVLEILVVQIKRCLILSKR